MTLAEQVYRQTAEFPVEERYALAIQMRRAATSIASNIAEGQGRQSSDTEFIRFLLIARGSLCELATQVELSARLKMIAPQKAGTLQELSDEVGRLLSGLIRAKRAGSK